MTPYTEAEMNEAIIQVEAAKLKHPQGWIYLEDFALKPATSYVVYAFAMSKNYTKRLALEDNREVIYSAGWLNGLSIGVALAAQRQ